MASGSVEKNTLGMKHAATTSVLRKHTLSTKRVDFETRVEVC